MHSAAVWRQYKGSKPRQMRSHSQEGFKPAINKEIRSTCNSRHLRPSRQHSSSSSSSMAAMHSVRRMPLVHRQEGSSRTTTQRRNRMHLQRHPRVAASAHSRMLLQALVVHLACTCMLRQVIAMHSVGAIHRQALQLLHLHSRVSANRHLMQCVLCKCCPVRPHPHMPHCTLCAHAMFIIVHARVLLLSGL